MAHHGYLEMEGGQMMIDFIAKQCCLSPDTVSALHCVNDMASQGGPEAYLNDYYFSFLVVGLTVLIFQS